MAVRKGCADVLVGGEWIIELESVEQLAAVLRAIDGGRTLTLGLQPNERVGG
ncbi:MAG TPA: hypothetical protein VI197_25815 [Polyangiaceae bacterium]